jgi:DNA polymerase-3 subunit gamma/tau
MAKKKATTDAAAPADSPPVEYTVVARRYRPQQFADLVGQEPVAQSLINAIQSGRIAHAYLFTGARGVGKTSAARILAKALNCEKGPTATPCDECTSCKAIATGDDVDVLEIDGASNRRIEEIRDIRQNVQFRPTRGRYKIYIIDEVHMLTKEAFNALLKTLEEPPPHVKFIFATTEAIKIPITILSRCQRFDFAGIATPKIVDRLKDVITGEGRKADDDALEIVARRAGGSMRDAQSLLDQLLAFGDEKLTADQVHKLLGTAPDDVIAGLAVAALGHDAKQALSLLDVGLSRGLQPGELLDQLIDYWRDLMLVGTGGSEVIGLNAPPRLRADIVRQAADLSLDTVLAGLDVLQAARARLRGSSHARVLVEMALVRLCRLDDLVALSQLAQLLQAGDGPAPSSSPAAGPRPVQSQTLAARAADPDAGKKKPPEVTDEPTATPLTQQTLAQVWSEVLAQIGPLLARGLDRAGLPAILGPNRLVLQFSPAYNHQREQCSDPARLSRVMDVLKRVTGEAWDLRLETAVGQNGQSAPETEVVNTAPAQPTALQHPLVQSAVEHLGAKLLQVDDGFGHVEPIADDDDVDALLTDPEE